GVMAYLEGWVLIKGGPHLDVATAFMNFHLQPQQYADFVNTTGTAYVSSAATPYIDKSIAKNPILFPTPEVLAKVEYENYLGEASRCGRRRGTSSSRRNRGVHAARPLARVHLAAAAPPAPEPRLVLGLLPGAAPVDRDPFLRSDQPRDVPDALRMDAAELSRHRRPD